MMLKKAQKRAFKDFWKWHSKMNAFSNHNGEIQGNRWFENVVNTKQIKASQMTKKMQTFSHQKWIFILKITKFIK